MLYHYTHEYELKFGHLAPLAVDVPFGRYGVQLFFVISGYVIFMTLNSSRSVIDFAVNRMIRLYPTYWAGMAVTFLALTVLPLPGYSISAAQFVTNLSMLQYWAQVAHVDGVYWTLAVELVFYAWIATLAATRFLPAIEHFIALWLAASAVLYTSGYAGHISPLIRSTLFLEHGHFFFAGILLYKLKHEGPSLWRHFLLLACVATAWNVRDLNHALALGCAIALVALACFSSPAVLCSRPLRFLGAVSYPLYLVHQNLGYTLIWRLEKAGLTDQIWLLVPLSVSLLIATAIHYGIEKPSLSVLKQRWKALRLKSMPA